MQQVDLDSIDNNNQQLVSGLNVHHQTDISRIDSLFVIGTYSEITGDLIREMSKYIHPKKW